MSEDDNPYLEDNIWGIEGTYADKRKAKGRDSDVPLYYVQYYPSEDASNLLPHPIKLIKRIARGRETEETPEPIPISNILEDVPTENSDVPGVPDKKTVLQALEGEDAPWAERINREVDTRLESREKQLQNRDKELSDQKKDEIKQKNKEDEKEDTTEKMQKLVQRFNRSGNGGGQ